MKVNTAITVFPQDHVENQSSKLPDLSNKIQSLTNKEMSREIKLRKQSKELEAVFLTQLFKAMEKTVPKNSTTGSKNSLATMMFSSVMGEALADQGGIGLADIIFESLKDKESFPSMDKIKSNDLIDYAQIFRVMIDSEVE